MKRFTETNKWSDPWWRKLSSAAKQLQGYMWDNCNQIGLVEVDFSLVSTDCGQKIDESNMLELGERVQAIGAGKYFLPKFIHFQYGELSSGCPPHKTIIKLVRLHKLEKSGFSYNYPSATLALPTRQDKTRMEPDKKEDKGVGEGEIDSLKASLSKMFNRDSGDPWSYADECALLEVLRRKSPLDEVRQIDDYRLRAGKYFPRSLSKLLSTWDSVLDAARNNNNHDPNKPYKPQNPIERDVDRMLKTL